MQSTPATKRCPKCQETKPSSEWNKNRRRYDGLSSRCSACTAAYHREWRARPDVRERQAKRAAGWYASLTEDDRQAYIDRGTEQRRRTSYNLRSKYGITGEEYEALLESQGGGCAICGKEPNPKRRHAVDHDHSCCPGEKTCGKCLRGILCTTCNVWLGFYENEEWMTKARNYLDSHRHAYLDRLIAKESL